MLEKLQASDFSPYLNQTFLMHMGPGEPVEAELVEVTEHEPRGGKKQADSSGRTSFSILLRCPKGTDAPQNTYKIEHQEMGTLHLFLVPIGPDEEGMRFEAVFN